MVAGIRCGVRFYRTLHERSRRRNHSVRRDRHPLIVPVCEIESLGHRAQLVALSEADRSRHRCAPGVTEFVAIAETSCVTPWVKASGNAQFSANTRQLTKGFGYDGKTWRSQYFVLLRKRCESVMPL